MHSPTAVIVASAMACLATICVVPVLVLMILRLSPGARRCWRWLGLSVPGEDEPGADVDAGKQHVPWCTMTITPTEEAGGAARRVGDPAPPPPGSGDWSVEVAYEGESSSGQASPMFAVLPDGTIGVAARQQPPERSAA